MIDKNLIGHEFEAVTLPVEEGRLRFVAKSIGETNPVYSDPEAARKAGHPALPAPPTFVFMLEVDAVDLQDLVSFFGCKLGQLLHGEQGFVYHAPIYAGDRITVKKRWPISMIRKTESLNSSSPKMISLIRMESKWLKLEPTT